jgi:hypothetical protein
MDIQWHNSIREDYWQLRYSIIMHPLAGDLTQFKDSEIESKINDLTRKYFSTYNFDLQRQISMMLDAYKSEMANRRQREYEKMMNSRNKDLDKLINVS